MKTLQQVLAMESGKCRIDAILYPKDWTLVRHARVHYRVEEWPGYWAEHDLEMVNEPADRRWLPLNGWMATDTEAWFKFTRRDEMAKQMSIVEMVEKGLAEKGYMDVQVERDGKGYIVLALGDGEPLEATLPAEAGAVRKWLKGLPDCTVEVEPVLTEEEWEAKYGGITQQDVVTTIIGQAMDGDEKAKAAVRTAQGAVDAVAEEEGAREVAAMEHDTWRDREEETIRERDNLNSEIAAAALEDCRSQPVVEDMARREIDRARTLLEHGLLEAAHEIAWNVEHDILGTHETNPGLWDECEDLMTPAVKARREARRAGTGQSPTQEKMEDLPEYEPGMEILCEPMETPTQHTEEILASYPPAPDAGDVLDITCYTCGMPFEPAPEKLAAWGNSGKPFDPTDWQCQSCKDTQAQVDEAAAAHAQAMAEAEAKRAARRAAAQAKLNVHVPSNGRVIALPPATAPVAQKEENTMSQEETQVSEVVVAPVVVAPTAAPSVKDILQQSFLTGTPALVEYVDQKGNMSTRHVKVIAPPTERVVVFDGKSNEIRSWFLASFKFAVLRPEVELPTVAKMLAGFGDASRRVLIAPSTSEGQKFGRPQWETVKVATERVSSGKWVQVAAR